MKLQLQRRYFSSGTNGILTFNGQFLCHTIELPWRDNQRRISCIPEGTYRIRKRYSDRYRWHFELMDVRQRTAILIHAANDAMKELQGCIAPVTVLTGEGRGSQSRAALDLLKDTLYPFLECGFVITLEITDDEK